MADEREVIVVVESSDDSSTAVPESFDEDDNEDESLDEDGNDEEVIVPVVSVPEKDCCFHLAAIFLNVLFFLGHSIDNFAISCLFFFLSSIFSSYHWVVILVSGCLSFFLLFASYLKSSWRTEISLKKSPEHPFTSLSDVVGSKCCFGWVRRLKNYVSSFNPTIPPKKLE
tara:strand:+ start:2132 stop:2641 length:510 start_codon:yes stop_codon:yes gene_type:complete